MQHETVFTDADVAAKGEMGIRVTGPGYTGHIRLHEDVYSRFLDNHRSVWVYLPPGYEEHRQRRYPVLYLQDGQNVFSPQTAFGGIEWEVDETVEQLIRKGRIEELIVVAVANTSDRTSEYTHVPDPEHGGGRLDLYARFLIEEVKPMIDKIYRTRRGPANTGIMGSSLGGLSATYLGWFHADVFGVVAAISPSYWWADRDLTRRIREDPGKRGPRKIWIDMGSAEGADPFTGRPIPEVVAYAREMGMVLMEKGYLFGHELFYLEITGAGHSEAFWHNRVRFVLMALYGKVRKN